MCQFRCDRSHERVRKVAATLILAGISATCWLLYLYPYLFYPVALRLLKKRPIHPNSFDGSASLLFCAYNEIECLPRKIENLRELRHRRPGL